MGKASKPIAISSSGNVLAWNFLWNDTIDDISRINFRLICKLVTVAGHDCKVHPASAVNYWHDSLLRMAFKLDISNFIQFEDILVSRIPSEPAIFSRANCTKTTFRDKTFSARVKFWKSFLATLHEKNRCFIRAPNWVLQNYDEEKPSRFFPEMKNQFRARGVKCSANFNFIDCTKDRKHLHK